jgi:RNA polymerase sigma-70 factor (ECF subfamily)
MNPQELITKARLGDKEALTQLLLNSRGIISGVVARLVWEKELSRDVVQNIFVRIIRGLEGFRAECRFSTWVYRIAVNECMEANYRAARHAGQCTKEILDIEIFPDPNAPDGLKALSDLEIRTTIRDAVVSLPLDLKTAFSLYYFAGYSGREAGESLGISEANFFMRLKTARDKVKKILIEQGWER